MLRHSRRLRWLAASLLVLAGCPSPMMPPANPQPSPSPTVSPPAAGNGGSTGQVPGIDGPAGPTPSPTAGPSATVSTLAGSIQGFADGPALSARFDYPTGLGVDQKGNLYIAEQGNVRVRRLSPDGLVSTYAGSGEGVADGPAATAKFLNPNGISLATDGTVFVADAWGSHRIRRILTTGVVETLAGGLQGFADGQGAAAQLNGPRGLAVGSDGNLYVADTGNHCIRTIFPSGVVGTLVGGTRGYADGIGNGAQFDAPTAVAVAADGTLFVADSNNDRIRKVSLNGKVTTFAGGSKGYRDGQGTAAQFNTPAGMAFDGQGNLYVADAFNARIRRITPAGLVSTIAGSANGLLDGPGDKARFSSPFDVVVAANGDLYVADQGNHLIRRVRLPPTP